MKSRTSSFNLTVFKKDITRFAPAWGAYLIFLLLVLMNLYGESDAYWRLRNVPDAILAMATVNMIYACVVAQLIFGDLYNSRLCNALHAMPVTREGWFVTHTVSGFAFSFLPNLVLTLIAFPVLRVEAGWPGLLWWLLGAELQYIFFFGVAVLCVMLSGNRLGQLALYAMMNFAGLAAWWLASVIYQPLLPGIQFNGELFYPFCPVGEITQIREVLVIDHERIVDEFGNFLRNEVYGVAPGQGWGYMAIIAAIGVLALIGGLVLYRKRNLECAGDFVAFRKMEPVVQVLVTLFAGGFFHLFGDVFGLRMKYVLIICGMIVGFFACRMLLLRSTRVFQKKGFLGCGAILAVFGLTLALTTWDPMGITTYIPEADEIESITFSDSYSIHRHSNMRGEAVDPADIEAILGVHSDCIDGSAHQITGLHPDSFHSVSLRLEYKLKNGKTVNRFYDVYPLSEAGQVLKGYYTKPECVLGFPPEQAHEMAGYIRSLYSDGTERNEYNLEGMDLEGLMDAIIADCEAGNMAQFDGYHYPANYNMAENPEQFDFQVSYLEIGWDVERMEKAHLVDSRTGELLSYRSLQIYLSCENTIRWMLDNDLMTELSVKETLRNYGYDGPTVIYETGEID